MAINIRLSDIPKPKVKGVEPDDTVRTAHDLMDKFNVDQVPILDDGMALLDVVTRRQLVTSAVAESPLQKVKAKSGVPLPSSSIFSIVVTRSSEEMARRLASSDSSFQCRNWPSLVTQPSVRASR